MLAHRKTVVPMLTMSLCGLVTLLLAPATGAQTTPPGGGNTATQHTTVQVTGGDLAIVVPQRTVDFEDVAPGGTTPPAPIGDISYINTQSSGVGWTATVAATSLVSGNSTLSFKNLTFTPGSTITPREGSIGNLTPGPGGSFSGDDTTAGTPFSDALTVMTGPGTARGIFDHKESTATLRVPPGVAAGDYSGKLQYTLTG